MKKLLIIATMVMLLASLIFSGCTIGSALNNSDDTDSSWGEMVSQSSTTDEATTNDDSTGTVSTSVLSSVEGSILDVTEMFTDRDSEENYEDSDCTIITLTNESQTISTEGVYIADGSLTNGQIIVDVPDTDKVQLILNNVNINCNYSAPIYIKSADKVFITLAENSTNRLSVDNIFTDDENNVDGVIFSNSDLSFNGSGTLEIESDYMHGIVGKDDVVFTNGIFNISTAQDGIQANDSIRTTNAEFNIISGQSGIQTKNGENGNEGFVYFENTTINIESNKDGISSVNYILIQSGVYNIDSKTDGIVADTSIIINDGTFSIITGGGYQKVLNSITLGEGSDGVVSETDKLTTSMKSIKAVDIFIVQGNITLSSYEDGINADNNINISNGSIIINSGDEALTAKNELNIDGGTIRINNAYEGFEGAYITINDGNIEINVLDDGINANESFSLLTITGGNLSIKCQGDGIDSNGDLVIDGGNIVLDVSAIYAGGDGNIDVGGTVTYNGGTIVDENGNPIDPTEQLGNSGRTNPGTGGRLR